MAQARATRIFAGAGHLAKEGFRGGLFRISPGEREWHECERGLPELVEVRALAVHPQDPDVIYAGTQDGPYRSIDGGNTWERPDFPKGGAMIWSIAFHPTRHEVMYAGAAPVALYRSENGGDTWTKLEGARSPEHCPMGFPTRVVRIVADGATGDDVYAGLEVSGVIRSSDGGETWTDMSDGIMRLAQRPHLKSRIGTDQDTEGMLDTHALAVSPALTGAPFLATRMGLFRSADRGAAWHDMEIGRFSPLTYCRDVIVSPHDARVMYACLSPAARSTDGSLYRTTDLGATWSRFDRGVKANATMMAAAVHPADPARVYCVSRCGQVFGTEDGGESWREYRLPEDVGDAYAVACA
ncbi:MAG: WD40/YVTN/BNR-like repeat-containing protein [Burkholderiales bacterium]